MTDDVRHGGDTSPSPFGPNAEVGVDWARLELLFFELLDLPEDERPARLAREEDETMRREAEAMLLAHEGPELSVESLLLSTVGDDDLSGRRIGPYRLLDRIGRGGMGEVYRARRDDAVYDRIVAVKLVQPGLGRKMHERFERERAILARLTHPYVATLHDGGVTDDGRPFLVMEYVDGTTIIEHCDERRSSLRERIELFLAVCEAVQSAHAALVIHRDLKPSNILVDAEGRPKLLDFGIARLLEDDDASRTVGLDRMLTPEHAAPEQIRGADPTTATDVYGLGVLLCELLVGERPLRFTTLSPVEIDRIVREVEPTVPSGLFAALDDDARAERAARRRTRPERLRAELRGDLDAICAKAVRKEMDERYSSVAELAEDLRRRLEARPVHAMRGSRSYVARKFVRRHRTSLTLSALAFVVLTGFLGFSVQQAREVRFQRDLARVESTRANLVLDRLVDLFETTGPQVAGEGDVLDVDEFLRRGEEAARLLADDAEARAKVLDVLSDIHANRGALGRAIERITEARDLATDPMTRLRREHRLAVLRTRHEGVEIGLPLLRASREKHRQVFGPGHPDAVIAAIDLGRATTDEGEARTLLESALARIGEPGTRAHRDARAAALNALAMLEFRAADPQAARHHLEQADALLAWSRPEWASSRLTVQHNLASVYTRLGLWERAEPVQRRLVELRRRVSGPTSDRTAATLEAHGVSLANLGRSEESAERFAASLAIFRATLDPGHWRIANAMRNVGRILDLGGRHDEALPHFERAIQITSDAGRPTAHLRGQRALALWSLGRVAEARVATEDAFRDIAASTGEFGRRALADGHLWSGMVGVHDGDLDAAEGHFRQAHALRRALYGDAHPLADEALCGIAVAGGVVRDVDLAAAAERYRRWGLADPRLLAMMDAADR